MKGSIRFDNDINIEVDVDKSAEEGAKLTSAVNLVDGQEIGGAGGNYKEVITGTAAAPFGDYSAADLATALYNNDIHADISLDGSALGITTEIILPVNNFDETPDFISARSLALTFSGGTPTAIYQATDLGWNLDGSLRFAAMYAGGTLTDVSAYGSVIPTVLTIYHHPMPEE